jgi:energy-coupling factor transporter ATP-binding protein EcfA2
MWDLHVHTPASFHWKGKRFRNMTAAESTAAVDQLIDAINRSDVEVFALMDYWTFDGWFALKKRLAEAGAPKCTKRVFPGIELRLQSPTPYRLNAHVIFADDIADQDLRDFKSRLQVALVNRPLSDDCLVRLAVAAGADLLRERGFKKEDVEANQGIALDAGSTIADVTADSYRDAIKQVPSGKAIGFMPWETHDGLKRADWKNHYSYVIELMQSSVIFETRRPELWAAFNGVKIPENQEWFEAFQSALGGKKLAVSGSDAHRFADYGRFPGGKVTWIKADPTFLGLQQAIKEPAKRSHLGDRPSKLVEVEQNKTYFIDRVAVEKQAKGTGISERWLADCALPLSSDLVAIIGNKGSGKSALADVIALLGSSRSIKHFSFLSERRFRAQPVPARHFQGHLKWVDGTEHSICLADDPDPQAPELIKYIPQAYFEELCNSHVSGQSDRFEKELRSVVFAHVSASVRREALDFDQLVEREESGSRSKLAELRKELQTQNASIAQIEASLAPAKRNEVNQLLALKQRQIEEHEKLKPAVAMAPAGVLSPEQQAASLELKRIGDSLKELGEEDAKLVVEQTSLAAKLRAIDVVRQQLALLARQHKQFVDTTKDALALLGLLVNDVLEFSIKSTELDKRATEFAARNAQIVGRRDAIKGKQQKLTAAQEAQQKKLDEPQLRYQQSLKAFATWEQKKKELVGAPDIPDSLEGIKARLAQLDLLPAELMRKRVLRNELAGELFEALDEQRRIRTELFKPVQDLIEENELIKNEYKLQFQATLAISGDVFAGRLFTLIKQAIGDFRGEAESIQLVKRTADKYDFSTRAGALGFAEELADLLSVNARKIDPGGEGIGPMLRIGKSPHEVYDLLFGLGFLEPRYTLLFQDTPIEYLSPGQRGALLLIFYLLVDKGRNPIVLDQPEENLDNETVVSLLVPVLTEAKKRRQIIMVTHNPNLAVVCDAEQLIFASFDRKADCTIAYMSGSIEHPRINACVVDVLEGTKPAFQNRQIKYH